MIPVFVSVAVLLVAFGGLMAAVDAALASLSRADLQDLAVGSRAAVSVNAIAADVGAHVNAVNFVRVVAETTAAVLITLALSSVFPQWWWVLLLSALTMTIASFVLVGSSPRSVGRVNARAITLASSPTKPSRQLRRRDRLAAEPIQRISAGIRSASGATPPRTHRSRDRRNGRLASGLRDLFHE